MKFVLILFVIAIYYKYVDSAEIAIAPIQKVISALDKSVEPVLGTISKEIKSIYKSQQNPSVEPKSIILNYPAPLGNVINLLQTVTSDVSTLINIIIQDLQKSSTSELAIDIGSSELTPYTHIITPLEDAISEVVGKLQDIINYVHSVLIPSDRIQSSPTTLVVDSQSFNNLLKAIGSGSEKANNAANNILKAVKQSNAAAQGSLIMDTINNIINSIGQDVKDISKYFAKIKTAIIYTNVGNGQVQIDLVATVRNIDSGLPNLLKVIQNIQSDVSNIKNLLNLL